MEQEDITFLSRASSKGNSLKTTVPMSIVKHLKLREKDGLRWEVIPKENDFLIVVEPLEKRYLKERKVKE